MLEKQLNELNIYALRELARSTGVVSPTSKKKDELINEIIAIKTGKQQPQFAKVRQGRPPKGGNYNFQNIDKDYEYPRSTLTNILKLNQETAVYESGESSTISGYVELLENGSALLWVNKETSHIAYFIPNSILASYKLKMGDFIIASAETTVDQKVVKELLTINGCPITKFNNKRKNYSDIEHVLPAKCINFTNNNLDSLNIKFGESVYLYGNNNNANTMAIVELLNNAKADDKLYINISLADKNKIFLKGLKAEKFIANLTDDVEKIKRVLCLAIERAKRSLEAGRNVIVAVDDVLSVASVDTSEMTVAKTLMSLTKCSKSGSVTLVSIMSNASNLSLLEKLADVRLKVEDNKLIKL